MMGDCRLLEVFSEALSTCWMTTIRTALTTILKLHRGPGYDLSLYALCALSRM